MDSHFRSPAEHVIQNRILLKLFCASPLPHTSSKLLSCFQLTFPTSSSHLNLGVSAVRIMGAVYQEYRTSDCAVMAVIFRAGEFKAAQRVIPGGQRLNSTVCLPAGVHRGGHSGPIFHSGNRKEDKLSILLCACCCH